MDILIVNLKRHGDIFSSSRLIHSLRMKYPDSQISLLIYKQFESSAKCLKQVDQIFTISRDKLLMIKKNKLFSTALGLDLFYQELLPVKNKNWDLVINYSHELVATYIVSFLQPKKYAGIKFSAHHRVECSNFWAMHFNEVMTTLPQTPFNLVDYYHKIADIPKSDFQHVNEVIPVEENKAFSAFKKIKIIKDRVSTNPHIKVIGIQIKSSQLQKDIPSDEVIKLCQALLLSNKYYPVLLIAPTEEEQELAVKINTQLENQATIIQCSFISAVSIILNCDAIISPDTSIKHLVDLCKTPLLEVATSKSEKFKQWTTRSQNVILHYSEDLTHPLPFHNDILFGLDHLLLRNFSLPVKKSSKAQFYFPFESQFFTFYRPYDHFSLTHLFYIASSLYTIKLSGSELQREMIQETLKGLNSKEVSEFIFRESEFVRSILKSILNFYEYLKIGSNTDREWPALHEKINALLGLNDNQYVASINIKIFKYHWDNYLTKDAKNIRNKIEFLIINLHKGQQIYSHFLSQLAQSMTNTLLHEKTSPHTFSSYQKLDHHLNGENNNRGANALEISRPHINSNLNQN